MKKNYKPISILPVLSKIFEKILFIQMSDNFEDIFDKQQCGIRKGYNTQQYLLKISKKWEISVDKGTGGWGGVVFSSSGCEMKIFSTVFRDFGKSMVGKRYSQH